MGEGIARFFMYYIIAIVIMSGLLWLTVFAVLYKVFFS